MKITADMELIDGATHKTVVHTGGLTRQDFTDRDDIENLRAGGKNWYIYQEPADFDPMVHKLGEMIYTAPYCTNDTLPLTPEEIAEQEDLAAQAKVERNNQIELQRRSRYMTESDPLFFGWQRGENTEQDWLDNVQQIKTELPYEV